MEKIVKFDVDTIEKIEFDDYSDEEFAIARMGFLSTRPNSHKLIITDEVLRESAKSVLNKWVVADMVNGEPTTHTKKEHIVGRVPKEQEVEFVIDEDGYLRAYVDTVISKIYAKDFCNAFATDNNRAVSVEMKVATPEDDENTVLSFNIVGVTVLGQTIRPSCPNSDITFVRFSDEEANNFFKEQKKKSNATNTLKQFVQERKEQMAEKTYQVDKSKEALSSADWGSYDKAAMRDKIMEAENRAELIKAVYMLVEDGWENAPSEHLKYPVMMLEGDTFVYNREALSSALAYAKQHDEQTVINKVEKIYKMLDLDNSEGKEDEKMAEIEFAAIEINGLWCQLYEAIRGREHWDYCMNSIYEENGQKFVILKDRAGVNFRLDFSLTTDGIVIADEVTKVEIEIVETDDVRKFAEVDDAELMAKYTQFASNEPVVEMGEPIVTIEELSAKITEMEAEIEKRDNIIMENETELNELRQFKASIEAKEKAMAVETVMEEVKSCLSDEQFAEFREEGLASAEFDAWANKVRAACFSALKKAPKKAETVFSFSAPVETQKAEPKDVWERLRTKKH